MRISTIMPSLYAMVIGMMNSDPRFMRNVNVMPRGSSRSRGGSTSKNVYDPKVAAMYQEIRRKRKIYNFRRRLPRAHPDKIRGPIATNINEIIQ